MSHSKSAFLHTLRIPLRPSANLFRLVIVYHCLALLVLFFMEFTIITWPFTLLVFISMFWAVYRFRHQKNPMNAVELVLDADDQWWLITDYGRRYSASVLPGGFVHPLLLMLSLHCDRKKIFIPLLADNTQPDVLRRLRVRLRFPRDRHSEPNCL